MITHKIVDDVLVEGAVVKVEQSIDCCPLLGVGWVETWLSTSRVSTRSPLGRSLLETWLSTSRDLPCKRSLLARSLLVSTSRDLVIY